MPRVYCQNEDCPYWKNLKLYKNYGKCVKKELYMTVADETAEGSKLKIACPHSGLMKIQPGTSISDTE